MLDALRATAAMLPPVKTRGIGVVEMIVGIVVAILVTMLLVPVALNQIGGVNSENWGDAADTLETLLVVLIPILAIIGIAMWFVKRT